MFLCLISICIFSSLILFHLLPFTLSYISNLSLIVLLLLYYVIFFLFYFIFCICSNSRELWLYPHTREERVIYPEYYFFYVCVLCNVVCVYASVVVSLYLLCFVCFVGRNLPYRFGFCLTGCLYLINVSLYDNWSSLER